MSDQLITLPQMAARVGMSSRTLTNWRTIGQVVTDGLVGHHPGIRADREPEIRAMYAAVLARKAEGKEKREERERKAANKRQRAWVTGSTTDDGPDLEAGVRRVVNQAFLDGSLGPTSPFAQNSTLPYPDPNPAAQPAALIAA